MWGFRGRHSIAVIAVCLAIAGAARGGEDEGKRAPPRVREHAPMEVAPSRPRPAAEYRRIEALVARLAELSEWRGGISESTGPGVLLSTSADEQSGDGSPGGVAFAELVRLGPAAIPTLLMHLDDGTPTKLVSVHGGGFGSMRMQDEIGANPANEKELAAIRSAFPGGWPNDPAKDDSESFFDSPSSNRHRVTVGDACFAALGQIVNRDYEAVRYQPTACIVVNSPTFDPRIARAVRNQWEGRDPRVELARRLLADAFTTEAVPSFRWDGEGQTGAAMRLAFYYPAESEAALLKLLDEAAEGEGPYARRRAEDLARALSVSERPKVRAALVGLALEQGAANVVDAVLPTLVPPVDERLFALIERGLRARGEPWRKLRFLEVVKRLWPDRYEAVLRKLLDRTILDAQVVAEAVWEKEIRLPVEDWVFWLRFTDRATPRTVPRLDVDRLRLCDVAAARIARQRDDLAFDPTADEAERDRQIEEIRRVLRKEGIR